jgi:hypothetical protein
LDSPLKEGRHHQEQVGTLDTKGGKEVSNLNPRQFKVYDFNAAKAVKNSTGRAAAIPVDNDHYSPELKKHDDEAMALGNPVSTKPSLYSKTMSYLGLE